MKTLQRPDLSFWRHRVKLVCRERCEKPNRKAITKLSLHKLKLNNPEFIKDSQIIKFLR